MCDGVYQLALKFSPMKPGGTGYRVLFIKRAFSPWMVIDEFYQRACHVTLGSKITFRFGKKTLHILPDVFSLPRPLSPAHAHEEKYGWLPRSLALPSLTSRVTAPRPEEL